MYKATDVPDMSSKTVLVTGANSGIGFEAARVFAERGARVLLGVRDAAKGADTCQRISGQVSDAQLCPVVLPLDDLAKIRSAVEAVRDEPRLDVLVNNAGVMVPPLTRTQDGFESQFGINHLGHFALTGLLVNHFCTKKPLTNDASKEPFRVVTVASAAHHFGDIDFQDLQAERSYKAGARYAMSKLANLLFTFELQRRFEQAELNAMAVACHPGGADTELARHMPQALSRLIQPVARLVINDASEGALPTLRAATQGDLRGAEYFGPAGWFEIARSATQVKANPKAHSTEVAARLWKISIELTGVDPEI